MAHKFLHLNVEEAYRGIGHNYAGAFPAMHDNPVAAIPMADHRQGKFMQLRQQGTVGFGGTSIEPETLCPALQPE
jgi:hypothetical protein